MRIYLMHEAKVKEQVTHDKDNNIRMPIYLTHQAKMKEWPNLTHDKDNISMPIHEACDSGMT